MMGAGSKYRPRSRRTVVGKLVLCLVAGVGCVSASVLSAQVAGAATDTVTNCSGSASDSGSLPYEVVNASSGDTISFSVTCPSNSPITLSSTIDISTNLTINGPGASSLVVSGNNAVEVFDVNASGVTVTISGLTIEDGSASNGGGIQNSGTLELTESDISSNIAGVGGGGINNNGTLDVTDTTVFGNSAGYGGGIWSDNTLSLANSNISDNSATSVVGAGGQGGGIENGGSLNITDSTLSGNSGAVGGGIDSGASNGQISTISNSTLSGNSSDYGGGILSRGINGSTFDVSNSTVADNHASFLGGGIDDVHTLTVTNSTLSGNGAPAGGGIEFSGGDTRQPSWPRWLPTAHQGAIAPFPGPSLTVATTSMTMEPADFQRATTFPTPRQTLTQLDSKETVVRLRQSPCNRVAPQSELSPMHHCARRQTNEELHGPDHVTLAPISREPTSSLTVPAWLLTGGHCHMRWLMPLRMTPSSSQ